jgi:DNA end-binding protein Ku
METLRYADELNKASSYFRDIDDVEPDADLLDLATTLIDKKTGKFDAGEFHNRYVDALRGLIEEKRKQKGGGLVIQDPGDAPRPKSNVIDLMAALKKSLGESNDNGDDAPAKKPAAKKASAKTPAPRKPATPRKAAGGKR